MSKPRYTVSIVQGPDCDLEVQAIRQVLESFNIRVLRYLIGRPNDFIDFISGEDYYKESDFTILSFHGDAGKFIMPKLVEDVYVEGESKENFGPAEVRRFYKLRNTFIINTACTLGEEKLAYTFLENGSRVYIGAMDYIDGNSSIFFVIRFFYELCTNNHAEKEAYELAKSTDNETGLFKWYSKE